MNSSLSINCLLCLNHDDNLINILYDEIYKPCISQILSQHFWFEAENNIYSNYICKTCWNIVQNFHTFYERTLEIHNAFYSKIPEDLFSLNDVEIKSVNSDCDDDHKLEKPLIERSSDECYSEKEIETKRRISVRLNHAKRKKKKCIEESTKIENEDDEIRKYYNMECELCGNKFDVFQDAKTHYRVTHSINGYLSCCGRKFRKRCYVLEHLHWHLHPNEFMCGICNRKYADKRGLQIHQLTHLPVNMKPFKCPKCPQSFAKNFLLRQHQVKHITDEEKSFFCDCGKAFATKCLLQFHKRGAHEGAFTHVCEICAKSFKSRLFYRNHMKNVHSTSDKPRVQCGLCSAWLKHEYSLRKHMARHEDSNNTYICNICEKPSPNRGALKSHQKYVHGSERNHKCNACSKAFKKAVALKEHMTIHTGEVLYTCRHCPKTFNSSANMHSHRKKSHTKEWEENRRNKIMVYNKSLNIQS